MLCLCFSHNLFDLFVRWCAIGRRQSQDGCFLLGSNAFHSTSKELHLDHSNFALCLMCHGNMFCHRPLLSCLQPLLGSGSIVYVLVINLHYNFCVICDYKCSSAAQASTFVYSTLQIIVHLFTGFLQNHVTDCR
jgi:hypothetical protein